MWIGPAPLPEPRTRQLGQTAHSLRFFSFQDRQPTTAQPGCSVLWIVLWYAPHSWEAELRCLAREGIRVMLPCSSHSGVVGVQRAPLSSICSIAESSDGMFTTGRLNDTENTSPDPRLPKL